MEKPNDLGVNELRAGMVGIQMPTLIIGVQSDVLFPVWQQKQIAELLTSVGNNHVAYYELTSKYGHDTFLIDHVNVGAAVKGHLENNLVHPIEKDCST